MANPDSKKLIYTFRQTCVKFLLMHIVYIGFYNFKPPPPDINIVSDDRKQVLIFYLSVVLLIPLNAGGHQLCLL